MYSLDLGLKNTTLSELLNLQLLHITNINITLNFHLSTSMTRKINKDSKSFYNIIYFTKHHSSILLQFPSRPKEFLSREMTSNENFLSVSEENGQYLPKQRVSIYSNCQQTISKLVEEHLINYQLLAQNRYHIVDGDQIHFHTAQFWQQARFQHSV